MHDLALCFTRFQPPVHDLPRRPLTHAALLGPAGPLSAARGVWSVHQASFSGTDRSPS